MSQTKQDQILANTEKTLDELDQMNIRLDAMEGGEVPPGELPPTDVDQTKDVARPMASTNMMDRSCFEVWQQNLDPAYPNSPNKSVTLTNPEGLSIGFIVPKLDGNYDLKVTDKSDASTSRYGVMSDRRDFKEPFHSEIVWGVGGNVYVRVGPGDEGKHVYVNIRPSTPVSSITIVANYTFRPA